MYSLCFESYDWKLRCHESIENIKSIVNGGLFKNICDYLPNVEVDRWKQMHFTIVFSNMKFFRLVANAMHILTFDIFKFSWIYCIFQSINCQKASIICTIFLDLHHMLFALIQWMFDFIFHYCFFSKISITFSACILIGLKT